MQAGNGTGDPADYGQGGSGGGASDPTYEKGGSPTGLESGHVDPGKISAEFEPSGDPPWWIRFENTQTHQECTKYDITDSGAIVTIEDWDTCQFSDAPPEKGSNGG